VNFTFDDWLPWYNRILETFGYDQQRDQCAADLLSTLLEGRAGQVAELRKLIAGRPALVFGAGPSLEEDLREVMKEGLLQKTATVVADGATTAFIQISRTAPNVIVSDLDGIISDILYAQRLCATVVIHAHGDNIDKLKKYVPEFPTAIGSTQASPRANVHNFLGFTDGDRAVFLAAGMGAKLIALAGMDFGYTVGKYSKKHVASIEVKRKKLKIGKELLEWLASETGEKIKLFNITAKGDPIKGFKNIKTADLQNLI
jgi:2-amino-4-hydroxy-6-hydroxymethyldihydropteridine diphosphokinase